MKQAYLITAYKDFDQLFELANLFCGTNREDKGLVYIHVDAKSKSITDDQIARLNAIEGCRAIRMFRIEWGSFAHLRAILALMILALMDEEAAYLHLLTGEDFPLVSPAALEAEFLGSDQIFFSYIPPKDQGEVVVSRYRYRNLFADKNMKNRLLWSAQKGAEKLQEKAGYVRDAIGPFTKDEIYKGLVYCSMPREAARYAVRFAAREGAAFWEGLKSCQVPEEFFFQTIFLNAPEWKDKVVDRELRYMDWERGGGSSPAYLTEGDYDSVQAAKEAGYRFARKFHATDSAKLRERLRREIGAT